MFRSFDVYGKFETSQLILCNPNGKELSVISHALHIKPVLRIGGYSELSFEVSKIVDGKLVKYYDLLQKLRLVKLENYGVFVIDDIKEHRDGIKTYKSITCKSIDVLFALKSLIDLDGTYKLYDILGGESIMRLILEKMPDWSIGEFDADLMNTYRTYNISEQNLYDLMMNDLSEDFQCVFTFDTFNKLINIKTTKNQIKKTDIFVSFENLLKDIEISTVTDNIKTSLEVYGADNLSIHEVNPLGSTIYNFDYFKNTEWLSQETIDAINVWESKVEANRIVFANNLTQIKDLNTTLIGYKIQLTDLESELKALENVLSAQVTQNISTSETLQSIANKNNEIDIKKSQITQTEMQITTLKETNSTIQDNLKLSNNLTETQLLELMSISNTTSGTYTNDAFVKTSDMSNVEIQEEAQRLYDLALTVLEKESQPRYTFTANIINFLALQWAEKYSNQLELGCEFTVGIDDDTYFYPVLLEYSLDFDDLKSCTMTFSNGLRLTNDQFDFASLFNGIKSTVSSVSTSKGLWEDYVKSGDKDSLYSLKHDTLDLATKSIKSTSGQDFLIDQTGIRGRKLLDGNVLSPNQLWMANNGIYMTTDNWQTSSLALGDIVFNGVKKYGLATELLIGNLIAGESLVIKNQNNTVSIDAKGLIATNASITLNSASGNNQILINPDDAIRIKSKIDGELQDVFYIDIDGNLNFKGTLTGAKGTFSGDINASNFIGGTINIGYGNFEVDEGGNCTANSLNLNGGSINVNDQFTVDKYGNARASSISLVGGDININDNFIVDSKGNCTTAGNLTLGGNINMTGNISWKASSSPVKVQYSVNGSTSWHEAITSNDKYAKYSYDGGTTWTQAIKIRGEDGKNGADGVNGSDAFVPEYITQTYIDSVEIKSPTISGNVVNSATFNGGVYKTWKEGVYGGQLDSSGLHVYNGTTQIGDFTYTNTNPNGNANAMLIQSKNGYALKITSGGDISIEPNSSSNSVWIKNAKFYGTLPSLNATAVFG